jgi:hypothetical protein
MESHLVTLHPAKTIAKYAECFRGKVDICLTVKPYYLYDKPCHVTQESGAGKAITGSSNFTVKIRLYLMTGNL